MKLPSIGIIRGEELGENLSKTLSQNKTLAFAVKSGMKLKFVNRTDYRQKVEMTLVQEIIQKSPSTYVIPEGGTNKLAIKGCREILNNKDDYFDVICYRSTSAGRFNKNARIESG